jgi:hypothetical protein
MILLRILSNCPSLGLAWTAAISVKKTLRWSVYLIQNAIVWEALRSFLFATFPVSMCLHQPSQDAQWKRSTARILRGNVS